MTADTARLLVVYAIALALGAALLSVSRSVQETERALEKTERETAQTLQAAHMLEVEWHYLSRPERLEALMRARQDAQGEGQE